MGPSPPSRGRSPSRSKLREEPIFEPFLDDAGLCSAPLAHQAVADRRPVDDDCGVRRIILQLLPQCSHCHAQIFDLVCVCRSGSVAEGVTLYGKLWTMTNFDPADTVTLASADVAIAYVVSPNWQLDLGANFGLTRHTPHAELDAGVSLRF